MKTKEILLHAAMEQFSEHGYNGAGLQAIAEHAGIRKSSIYHHFSSKEELFLGVVESVYEAYVENLRSLVSQGHGPREILEQTALYLKTSWNGQFFFRFIQFPPPEAEESVHRKFLQFEADCTTILQPVLQSFLERYGVSAAQLSDVLDAYYVLLDGWCVQALYYGETDKKQKQDASWNMFEAGIRGVGGRWN
ncbi:TetR/AcrR family transcriptional regulator [Alkalicoccus urumqiensis]|nr:TetR/AcrR family transcriptional regulator [Alkalicoccus urumqiensis]